MPEFDKEIDRVLFACRLWLHTGFIGAVALAVGLLELLDAQTKWPWALALGFFGGLLAVASWRRGLLVIEHVEWAPAAVRDMPSDSISRTRARPIERGVTGVLIPLRPRRGIHHELRRPAPE
jgi:hypothetical protein